jgi:uncharacterized protein (DUF934 family)
MPLVKGGRIVEDPYLRLTDEAPAPECCAILVPAARFLADSAEFTSRSARVGVEWPNDRPVADLLPYMDRLSLIALVFPNFRDGRAYSQARRLREQYGFRGELRATGEVLRDQLVFMVRAGFDSFAVKKEADAEHFADAVGRYTAFYQPAADSHVTARQQRLGRRIENSPCRSPSTGQVSGASN